ncbi:hypothetical protein [Virgibacillus ainsalahensis]
MNDANFIRHGLYLQGFPVYEKDIPYIQTICHTINQAQTSLHAFPHLHQQVPITIVDKELML